MDKDAIIIDNTEQTQESPKTLGLSVDAILARIDEIINNTEYIKSTLEALEALPSGDSGINPDFAGRAKAEALNSIIQQREATNQQMIRFLEKMYDDLMQEQKPSEDMKKFRQIAKALNDYPPDVGQDILGKAAQQMFVKAGASIVK